MDWGAFQSAWHERGCRAVAGLAEANPGESLYAAAFHLSYLDGEQILPSALAVNAEAAVREEHGYSTRFLPPEWRWDVLGAEEMAPWYRRLTEEYLVPASGDAERDAAMVALGAAHDAALAEVCKAMTATARRGGIHAALPPGFVVAVLEGQREDEEAVLIRRSVDPAVLATVPELADHLRLLEDA
ncbi:DUF4303 domain-containing protein [Actinomadura sp. NEAU-AAG7]|uniref:DUF4303 domain-containing protein n=1 Tax=Actinomadura sp. NEAU-AAG7 TaxID=2839640 RepID=UPI001BE404D8|nr:DUF4303 domain-containing protein [Actinomadura sp. NEAU-AAG7]MBT2208279.1 DUF4303 domain-containing protein [Actinomadura sp. NEAU-AAG7]